MKKTPVLLALLLCAGWAQAQALDLDDLISLTGQGVQKFDAHLGRKSYKRDYESPRESPSNYNYYQQKKSKGEEVLRKVSYQDDDKAPALRYQTTSQSEFSGLLHDLKKAGYVCYDPAADERKPALYQKGTCSVSTALDVKDSLTLYTVSIQKTSLPKSKEVAYAEDLLKFGSHESLAAFFGEDNVRKDVFHYTDTEINKCSVLFPNTSREVIFIWNDEVNYRKPAFLIVGGHLQTSGTQEYTLETGQNEWQTRQGIFSGMKLQELEKLHGSPISFYSWNTDRPGVLAPTKTGAIDFSRLSIVFACLNCTDKSALSTTLINSQNAIADDRKIYISSLIILPEKGQATTAALR
ncbi:MAG: hypothetical protein JWP27_161 [Flaviaesturariibacter sp.]|nr:hypothetical protein [Flaviaesturariibacter sp.]